MFGADINRRPSAFRHVYGAFQEPLMLYSPSFARRFPLLALLLCPPLTLASEAQPTQFDTVTVTATHSEQSLGSVPSTVSVVDARQIDQQQIKNMKDLVRYEPGVSVSGTGSRFGLSGISIRGIGGNRVLTQVDGVSVPGEFAFGPFLSAQRNYIDLDTVKQVEIIRGPASTLYGSDAIGGAVSFLTKDAGDYLEDGDDSYARLKTGYDGGDDSWQRHQTDLEHLVRLPCHRGSGLRPGVAQPPAQHHVQDQRTAEGKEKSQHDSLQMRIYLISICI